MIAARGLTLDRVDRLIETWERAPLAALVVAADMGMTLRGLIEFLIRNGQLAEDAR